MRTVNVLTAVLMKILVFLNIQRSAGRVTDIFGKAYCLRITRLIKKILTYHGMETTNFYEISVSIYR
jgi:hypothetical protein